MHRRRKTQLNLLHCLKGLKLVLPGLNGQVLTSDNVLCLFPIVYYWKLFIFVISNGFETPLGYKLLQFGTEETGSITQVRSPGGRVLRPLALA